MNDASPSDPRPDAGPAHGARPLEVTVLVTEESFASTAVGPIEIFHSAGALWDYFHGRPAEPRFRVRIASVDGRDVRSLCALGLRPACGIEEVEHTDIVVVPASGLDIQWRIARESGILPWLRRCYERGAYIAGICTGVAFLAECGLLDGRRATTHWAVAELFAERYPQVLWRSEDFVTEDGRVLCSGGIYAAIDLSLYLVEKFCGHEVAVQCAKSLLLSMPRMCQTGYGVLTLSRPHADAKIREIEQYMVAHLADDLSIEGLAARGCLAPRTFVRRFKAATGRLPGEYVQALRVNAARELFELGSLPVSAVCLRVGYEDVGFFRRIFRRHTGMSPSEYRSQYGRLAIPRGELSRG